MCQSASHFVTADWPLNSLHSVYESDTLTSAQRWSVISKRWRERVLVTLEERLQSFACYECTSQSSLIFYEVWWWMFLFFLVFYLEFLFDVQHSGQLLLLGVLRSGFLRPITGCQSQKPVSADPITDTDLFTAIFLSCTIIYSDTPISIFRHLFSAWISFLKMGGIPLLGDSRESGFF